VALTALLMALTALSIDIMLPSLDSIAKVFKLTDPNDRQGVVTSYFLGLAAGQLVYGPLSDRFGRKRVLLIGLGIYLVGSLTALLAGSFMHLLAARVIQGFGGAASRVLAVAIIRDLFTGRQMARVMSIAMMVFIVVPVFAPAVGQGLMKLGDWSWPFRFLLLVGTVAGVWSFFRLPETRALGEAAQHAPEGFANAFRIALTTRVTFGYMLAIGFLFGCLASYIGSAQQVFVETYKLGDAFPVAFGAVASVMAGAAFVNSQLVQTYGMRRVSHSALVGFMAAAIALAGISLATQPPLLVFAPLAACIFFCFGLTMPNFNAIAMQPLGRIAGTASSLIGFYTTSAGALFGVVVGRMFDGTVRPLCVGFAVLSLLAGLTVLAVEGRKGLFRGE
jgi:DHA1 family bicyclomycin/chloramphenicol resistance-like MFS transporter